MKFILLLDVSRVDKFIIYFERVTSSNTRAKTSVSQHPAVTFLPKSGSCF